MSQIKDLLTDENVRKVADDVVSAFENANKDELDINYHVSNGIMKRDVIPNKEIREAVKSLHGKEVPSPNTAFSFDTKHNTMLWYINDTLCKILDNDSITEEEYTSVQLFVKNVINTINNNPLLVDRIRVILRKIVLGDADESLFPLTDISLVLFEFGSKEDYGDIISIQNYSRFNKTTQQFVGERKGISFDIVERRREFGFKSGKTTREIYDTIVTEQKAAGNPLYEYVLPEDVKIVKEAKECHMDIFADYSPVTKLDFTTKIEQMYKSADLES